MWIYEKKLQYPVRVGKCNPRLAKFLIEQYGGADGELAAALRYLNQRYTLPDKVKGLLTDIGTEEFAHLEMIATMVYKLTCALWILNLMNQIINLSPTMFTDHLAMLHHIIISPLIPSNQGNHRNCRYNPV
jgi:spore coat protein JC